MTQSCFTHSPLRHGRAPVSRSIPSPLATLLAFALGVGFGTLGSGCAAQRSLFSGSEPRAAQLTQKKVEVSLPAPDALRATSGELRRVALHWEPVLAREVAGYLVERASVTSDGKTETKPEAKPGTPSATSESHDFEAVARITDRFQVQFLDDGSQTLSKKKRTGLSDGTTYLYRVRCVDQNGRPASSASRVVTASTAPVPSAPEALRAYSHLPRKIALVWSAPNDPTVARYIVYRSPSARGPFEAIGETNSRHETAYVDSGLGNLRVFYYRVSAVNAAGGTGAPSAPERAVTKSEPLPPLGLAVDATKLGVNRIRWTPNVEADLAGYRVVRLRGGRGAAKPELVATLAGGEHSALDREVAAGEELAYQIVAFDADGLESAFSDPVPATSASYALEAVAIAGDEAQSDGKAKNSGILLRWNARRDEGFTAARVLRAPALAPFATREITRTPDDSFLDAGAKPGRRYRYRVILERSDGSQAPPSVPITVGHAANQTPTQSAP